mmetsp:Transcript_15733/g.39577  ORF Transcript_15733/g.39577 Transcript_15733/m.39577 type:complete len:209 (+) Transcript_15733:636-1262(+)
MMQALCTSISNPPISSSTSMILSFSRISASPGFSLKGKQSLCQTRSAGPPTLCHPSSSGLLKAVVSGRHPTYGLLLVSFFRCSREKNPFEECSTERLRLKCVTSSLVPPFPLALALISPMFCKLASVTTPPNDPRHASCGRRCRPASSKSARRLALWRPPPLLLPLRPSSPSPKQAPSSRLQPNKLPPLPVPSVPTNPHLHRHLKKLF